jgi:dTDP-4-amino-4,6-dideoxygalactose transaminase
LPPRHIEHAYYKYYAFVRADALRAGWNRDCILAAITARGIPCFTGSCSEIYLEKAFPPAWRPEKRFPVARELGETSLMFQIHPTLAPEQIEQICSIMSDVMHEATGA